MQHEQQLVAPLIQCVAQLLSTADYSTADARRNLPLTSSSQVKFVRKQILACLYSIKYVSVCTGAQTKNTTNSNWY